MANRLDYYFRQKVSEAELDLGFTYLEQADQAFAVDAGLVGVATGLTAAAQSSPNLTIQVASGVAYDKAGQRISVPSTQTFNLAQDYNAVSTAVAGAGNSKWLSVFVLFDRALSDARTDGNSLTVYFQRAEAWKYKVVQGAEASSPSRPALDGTGILICDVLRAYGGTTIANGAIYTDRREDAFVATGTTRSVRRGRAKDAVADLVGWYNAHVGGTADRHPAASIDYGGAGTWADGATNPATDLESMVDSIVTRLAATTASAGGARKIGAEAISGSPNTLGSGSVYSQLAALLPLVNAAVTLAGSQTISGAKTFSASPVFNAGVNVTYPTPRSYTRVLPLIWSTDDPTVWISDAIDSGGIVALTAVSNAHAAIEIDLPNGAVLSSVSVYVKPNTGHGALPTTKPHAHLIAVTPTTNTHTELENVFDAPGSVGAYEAVHALTMAVSPTQTIDKATKRYYVYVEGESGTNSVTFFRVLGITATYTLASPDEAAA